jgi:pimeloyl-ACP methyl ester carboxylesterase
MVHKSITSFDGIRIYYDVQRARKKFPFLIFIHAWPHNYTVWKKELSFFQKKGYSTLAPDLRGHGKSDKPEKLSDYSFKNFSKDIEMLTKKEKISSFILVGHSFGGMVALSYYSLFPKKVRALILLDTIYENPLKHISFLKYFNLTPLTKQLLQFIVKNMSLRKQHFPELDFSRFKDHSDFYYWLQGAKVTPMKSIVACLEKMVEFNKRKLLGKIKIPTLIIEGEKDTKTALVDVKVMAKKIKGSELKIIRGASHDTNIRRSHDVEEIILEFIQRRLR